jgi:hypothetical protein
MSTYTPIASQTLGSAVNSVTFSSIPQGYTDLIIVTNVKSTSTENMSMIFNSDTGSNYSRTVLSGNGSAAASARQSSVTSIGTDYNGYFDGSDFNQAKTIQVMNYSNSTTFKTSLIRSNRAQSGTDAIVGLWRNTNAITSITLGANSLNFVSGSTFSLYGIQVGDKAQKAQGGNIVTSDGTYVYHTFTSSGSFIPNAALTADYLVVAGGGGGGTAGGGAGGGGAGGYRTSIGGSALSLTAQAYTVTVGAGGIGGVGATVSTKGSNSTFSTITSTGGGRGGQGGSLAGGNGGSGGGSNDGAAGGTGNEGAFSPSEGNNGGASSGNAPSYGGGGGGGAGAAGTTGQSNQGGAGGNGTANSISGSSVTYAGGGGGGVGYASGNGSGAGGSGGGGGGGNLSNGTAGTANTGGGGGGSGGGGSGGAGGAGVVIIRYAI